MNTLEIINSLKEFSLTSCLTEQEVKDLVNFGDVRKIEKHKHVFLSGEVSDEIYFLLKGVVKITTHATDGREVIKVILHPQAVLSEHSIAGEKIRNNNAVVMTPDVVCLAVKVEYLRALMCKNVELANNIIDLLGRKLKYNEERLESLVLNDARERIVQFLKVNAQSFGQAIGYELLLRHDFTQQDIANFTGTSRQTVTTVLNDLKKTNKIHFKRKSILIRDIKALC